MERKTLKDILKKPLWAKIWGQIPRRGETALLIAGVLALSLISHFLPSLKKAPKPAPQSLDSLAPEGFVLVPVEISNGEDIASIIGSFGVADLYSYSARSGLPEDQAAKSLKIISPEAPDGSFIVLAPEKQAPYLFQYSGPFYAVIQNPGKKDPQIYKKKIRKKLRIIEEDF